MKLERKHKARNTWKEIASGHPAGFGAVTGYVRGAGAIVGGVQVRLENEQEVFNLDLTPEEADQLADSLKARAQSTREGIEKMKREEAERLAKVGGTLRPVLHGVLA